MKAGSGAPTQQLAQPDTPTPSGPPLEIARALKQIKDMQEKLPKLKLNKEKDYDEQASRMMNDHSDFVAMVKTQHTRWCARSKRGEVLTRFEDSHNTLIATLEEGHKFKLATVENKHKDLIAKIDGVKEKVDKGTHIRGGV
jgi:hypothetical protein